jgi:hypothetical protein
MRGQWKAAKIAVHLFVLEQVVSGQTKDWKVGWES